MRSVLYALASVTLIFIMAVVMFTGCENNSKQQEVKEDIQELNEDISQLIDQERRELEQELKLSQKRIQNNIDRLQANLKTASDASKAEIQDQIDILKKEANELDQRMAEMGKKINDGWAEFKKDTKESLQKIDQEINEMFSKES